MTNEAWAAGGLEIRTGGPLTTVQDTGRPGFAAGGFQECGAADRYAYLLANLLACNPIDLPLSNADAPPAALECTLRGISARFTADAIFALTGADMAPTLNGNPVAMYRTQYARAGDVLCMGAAKTGLRGYLAVYGGFAVPMVLGSRSTNLKCGMGGLAGRALKSGDLLPIAAAENGGFGSLYAYWKSRAAVEKAASQAVDFSGAGGYLAQAARPWRFWGQVRVPMFRVVPGPQEDAFTPDGLKTFLRGRYTVTADSNRMACKLQGPAVEMKNGADILSDGIVWGSIQISANGQPIVMLADHQTTGGYAKIGTVISADIPAMAQVRPGESVCFSAVTPAQAVAAYRREVKKLNAIKECLSL